MSFNSRMGFELLYNGDVARNLFPFSVVWCSEVGEVCFRNMTTLVNGPLSFVSRIARSGYSL